MGESRLGYEEVINFQFLVQYYECAESFTISTTPLCPFYMLGLGAATHELLIYVGNVFFPFPAMFVLLNDKGYCATHDTVPEHIKRTTALFLMFLAGTTKLK